jgi:hypothetical protein
VFADQSALAAEDVLVAEPVIGAKPGAA